MQSSWVASCLFKLLQGPYVIDNKRKSREWFRGPIDGVCYNSSKELRIRIRAPGHVRVRVRAHTHTKGACFYGL